MYSVTFNGFKTPEQAKTFADWYSGHGEQDAGYWLEENSDISFAEAKDIQQKEGNVIVTISVHPQ